MYAQIGKSNRRKQHFDKFDVTGLFSIPFYKQQRKTDRFNHIKSNNTSL